jgi:putative molybdopterin biosynthesis protein
MTRIEISYSLAPHSAAKGKPLQRLHNPLMQLLQAVRMHGSISAAAKSLGLSYRHTWGELKRWEAQLGQPLIRWERGQAARLAALGERLLFADQQAQARLAGQIEGLQAELERGLALAFDPRAQVLALHASHDEALARLRTHSAARQLHLDIHFTGSIEALRALHEGRCAVAGFHARLPSPAHSLAAKTYQPWLQPGMHKLMGFVQRSQGLMVARSNPHQVRGLRDVAAQGLRYVNRPVGTGTRVLLDELLAELGIAKAALQGYRKTEPSHQAAALVVAQGQADCALGIEAAAHAQGLDFVPLVQERYALVCHREALSSPAVQALCKLLRANAWLKELAQLPGYAPLQSGKILKMAQVLPWWQFED